MKTTSPTIPRTYRSDGTENPFLTGSTNFTASIFHTSAKFVETSPTKAPRHFRDISPSGDTLMVRKYTYVFWHEIDFKNYYVVVLW